MPSYFTNQPGQIPVRLTRRSDFRLQWSLRLLMIVVLATGPICWWLARLDWQCVSWIDMTQLGMIVGSSVLPCVVVVSILLQLDWHPLVATALVIGVCAALLTFVAGAELAMVLEREANYRNTGKGSLVPAFDLAMAVSLLGACISGMLGAILGALIGAAREGEL